MCQLGWVVVVVSMMVPSSLGAPQGDGMEDLQLNQDFKQQELGFPNDTHNIQKRFSAFRADPQPFSLPLDQQFRAWARMGDMNMLQMSLHLALNPIDPTVEPADGQAFIDSTDIRNWTALMWGARYGHEEVVSFLLELGATVNLQNNHGDTALLWAVGGGHLNVVEMLMKHFADPNIPENTGLTPVGVAAAMNREAELRMMDKYGHIDLDHEDHRGRTPINLAATVGQASMVQLIGYWGNIDVVDNNKMGPVHWAMNLIDTNTLQACLLLCPDLTLRDDRNNTALDIAIQVKNTAGEKVLRDYMAEPTGGCWLDGTEFPAKQYTFFDCKQIQCMCKGFWRHTGVFDPTCFGAGAGAGEYGETEGGGVGAGGSGTVKRQVNVLARQEIQRYDVNKTYEYLTTPQPSQDRQPEPHHIEDVHDDDHNKKKRDIHGLSPQSIKNNELLIDNVKLEAAAPLKDTKYDYMHPSVIVSSELEHQKSLKFAHP